MLPIGFVSSDDHSYDELFPEGGEQAVSTLSQVKFADEKKLATLIQVNRDEVISVTRSWSNQWEKHFSKPSSDKPEPSLVVKPVLKPSTEWKYNTTSPVIASHTDPIFRPNLLDHNALRLSSEAEANKYLETTYRLTPSEAAEEAAIRARDADDEDAIEEDEPIPAVRDRGYHHAQLTLHHEVWKGVSKFYTSKSTEIGCSSVRFKLASEAALFTDCMLYIKWYVDGDDMIFNFDTIDKFIRHHEAELAERDLTKSLAKSIHSVRAEVVKRATAAGNSRLTDEEVQTCLIAVLDSLDIDEDDDEAVRGIDLCWVDDNNEEMSDAEEDDESIDGVDVCWANPVFNAIYNNNTEIRPEYSLSGLSNKVVMGNRRKGLAKAITKAYNSSQGIDGSSDASQFQTDSGYVSSVHDHEHHDGYSAFEGKEEDTQRTKEEIAWRKRVAHQMRGLHLALLHKKV